MRLQRLPQAVVVFAARLVVLTIEHAVRPVRLQQLLRVVVVVAAKTAVVFLELELATQLKRLPRLLQAAVVVAARKAVALIGLVLVAGRCSNQDVKIVVVVHSADLDGPVMMAAPEKLLCCYSQSRTQGQKSLLGQVDSGNLD